MNMLQHCEYVQYVQAVCRLLACAAVTTKETLCVNKSGDEGKESPYSRRALEESAAEVARCR